MKQVLIIGGGFGGLAAARRLSAFRGRIAVTLVDRRGTADFLPLLPDIIGGRIPASAASTGLDRLARRLGFTFVHDTVREIDPERGRATCERSVIPYDAAIIAGGGEPNYYGNRAAQQAALPLNSCRDAERLAAALAERDITTWVIAGGGYTGVEIATQLWRRFTAGGGRPRHIVIVEAAPSILGPLPRWMKEAASRQLARLDIVHIERVTLADISGPRLTLSTGQVFESAGLIWCAGVQAPEFVRWLPFPKSPHGRVLVDPHLRVRERLYAAGDSAAYVAGGRPLRMSVQFARTQGACAAANVIRDFRPARPRAYRPRDPGFVLPLAGGASYGVVFGLRLKGRLPTALHYIMCVALTRGLRPRWRLGRALCRPQDTQPQPPNKEADMPTCCSGRIEGRSAGLAFLRWGLGLLFLVGGIGKLFHLAGFVQGYLLPAFAATFLPAGLVAVYGYALPFVETALGALLLLGLWRQPALLVSGLTFLSLAFGQMLLQKHDVVFQIMVYLAVTGVLLFLGEYDRWTVSGCCRSSTRDA